MTVKIRQYYINFIFITHDLRFRQNFELRFIILLSKNFYINLIIKPKIG